MLVRMTCCKDQGPRPLASGGRGHSHGPRAVFLKPVPPPSASTPLLPASSSSSSFFLYTFLRPFRSMGLPQFPGQGHHSASLETRWLNLVQRAEKDELATYWSTDECQALF